MTTNHYRYERQNEEIKNHKHYRLFCILCTNSIDYILERLYFSFLYSVFCDFIVKVCTK
jgi:hypothetical protein